MTEVLRYNMPQSQIGTTVMVAQSWGQYGKDTVKVGGIPAMSDFAFFLASNATSSIRQTYFKYGAWLGLGSFDTITYPKADSFVYKLFSKGWISKNQFTLLITSDSTLRVSFGGFNERFIAEIAGRSKYSDSLIKWMPQSKWSIQYSKIIINEVIIEEKPFTAYIDLNYTNIRIPRDHLRLIMEYIMKYKDCVKVDESPQSLFTCKCRNFYDC